MLHEIIETIVERLETLDLGEELALLARHVEVADPAVVDALAREHHSSAAEEAGRIAIAQLRLLEAFADQLRALEALSEDPDVHPGTRMALGGVLVLLCAENELPARVDSDAAVLLEPALVLHGLLGALRPWLPSFVGGFEDDADFELLRLGIPDYALFVLHERFVSLWTLFHRLRMANWLDQPQVDAVPEDFEHDPRFTDLATPRAPLWPPLAALPSPWVDEPSQACGLN